MVCDRACRRKTNVDARSPQIDQNIHRVPVVNNVSFSVKAGEITGYLGPNGSGKSTTVKMLTGLVEPSQGEILLDGVDVRRDLIGFKRSLGYVPEEAYVYPSLTGMEYLQLVGRLRGLPERAVNEKATELLRLFSLYLHRHAPLAAYSKGPQAAPYPRSGSETHVAPCTRQSRRFGRASHCRQQ